MKVELRRLEEGENRRDLKAQKDEYQIATSCCCLLEKGIVYRGKRAHGRSRRSTDRRSTARLAEGAHTILRGSRNKGWGRPRFNHTKNLRSCHKGGD